MESLNCIISHLRGSEIQFIRHYYDFKKTKGFERRSNLFDQIVRGNVKTNEEAMRSISLTLSRSAFSQIKGQLKGEILEVLSLHESTIKPSLDQDEKGFINSNCILAIDVLKDRCLISEAQEVERKLLDDCHLKELSAEAVIIQRNLLNPLDCYLDAKETQKQHIEMMKTAEHVNLLRTAAMAWIQCSIPFHKQAERKVALEHAHIQILPALRASLETTASVRVERYYHQLAFRCAFEQKDIKQARFHWVELSAATSKPHISFGSSRLYLHAFECLLLCESNELNSDSLSLQEMGVAISQLNGEGIAVAEQLYFLALSKRRYEVALTVVNFVLEAKAFSRHGALIARWSLYKAGLLLRCDQAAKCLRLLRATDLPLQQLDGGYISSAILELMCMIEQGNMSGIENRFDACSRMVRRRKSVDTGIDQARVRLILDALQHLIYAKYNFEATDKRFDDSIKALTDSSRDTSWDEFGLEVIDFGNWFQQRLSCHGTKLLLS